MGFGMMKLGSMVEKLGRAGSRSIGSSTTPKMKPATLNASHSNAKAGEWLPIQILYGMVSVALALGAHTAFQQIARSPSVHVNKRRRETMPEVEEPDRTVDCADKFINRSMLRKVAHIQDNKTTLSDPVHPDPFTRPRTVESLKTVGIEPGRR